MNKIKIFIKNNKTIVLSGAIIFLLINIIFIANGNWPYGNKSCAIYDLSGQVLPLYDLVFDFFQGKSSLFYSNRLAGGTPIFGVVCYFIMSPFYLLLLLGGRTNVYNLINFVFLVYLVCIAISMSYCLKKIFPKLDGIYQILLSIAYAVCAYILTCFTYMIWLNFLILCPLMIVAFNRMIKKKKYLLFSILTFFYIISCFGVGSTTQFVLLGIYYLYIIICIPKEDRKETLVRLTMSMFVGVMLSVIILLPCFLESRNGTRTGQMFKYIFDSALDKEIELKFQYYISEFAFSLFGIVFLLFSNKKDKINRFLSITIIALLLLSFIDVSFMLMNFGVNYGYPSRLSFLYTTLTVIAIAKLIMDNKSKLINAPIKISYLKQLLIWFIWCISLFLLIVLFNRHFDKFESLSSRFAVNKNTYNDNKIFLSFGCVFIFQFVMSILLFRLKLINKHFLKVATCLLFAGQILMSGLVIYGFSFRKTNYIFGNSLMAQCDEYDRVIGNFKNATIVNDTSGISLFSSMLTQKSFNTITSMGYEGKGNSVGVNGGTLFSHSLIGIKYFFSDTVKNSSWLTLVNKEVYIKENGAKDAKYLYKYKYDTSGAFVTDSKSTWDYNLDVFSNQNNISKNLGATENIFQTFSASDLLKIGVDNIMVNSSGLYRTGETTYRALEGQEAKVFISTNLGNGNILYYTIDNKIYNNGVNINLSSRANSTYTYTFLQDKMLLITIPENEDIDLRYIQFGLMNIANYETQFNLMKESQVKIKYTRDGFKLNINKDSNSELLVTNVNLQGLKAKINGGKTAIYDSACGFVGISLKAGDNNVKVYYFYPYLIPTLLIYAFCLVLVILAIKMYRKKERFIWLEKFIDPLYKVYCCMFIAFIYMFSLGVSIAKVIELL